MNLTSIPALQDNYIWTLNNERGDCLIVDPGEAAPVFATLAKNHWQPVAILLTHHHHDHTDGIQDLVKKHPNLVVYGPAETQYKGATEIVKEGDKVAVLGLEFSVLHTPGHTLGHISYFSFPYLFCGDTMFSAGCGRLFEGTPQEMYQSFQKINSLPDETLICCAHEYTLSNLKFAETVLPHNTEIERYHRKIKELRAKNGISLPTTLAFERKINVFLMTHDIDLQENITCETSTSHELQVFAMLRQQKDHF
ncbi:hydroxyacylglutathione hydrolase [Erwinia psidii]|uniref:Hydroxyacylglutathione hydrolase n=1 Tax=Erwinia psidii TaxID=69224 RepID=A0A3N6RWC6_9GAMM|nr:hydroxyacylglutathione hydrolase [Erwinia psidii]MCX8962849.1 hydroxyacylglutathione hydrolase [Erwinia psidii]MCX8967261.1 hydroxyacylglutathione hydrolase [Erwinia psidii]RQM36647.1 hydroxyacylglutathione hydrolase [Erwinia psidii]